MDAADQGRCVLAACGITDGPAYSSRDGLVVHPYSPDLLLVLHHESYPPGCWSGLRIDPRTGQVAMGILPSGMWTAVVKSKSTGAVLHSFDFERYPDGRLQCTAVDTGGTRVRSKFRLDSKDFAGAVVSGLFEDSKGHTYRISGKTSRTGTFEMVLKGGTASGLRAERGTLYVQKSGKIAIPNPNTAANIPRPPKSYVIEVNPTSFAPFIEGTSVVLLADISYSMWNKLKFLQASLDDLIDLTLSDQYPCKNFKLAIGTWNSLVDWADQRWLTRNDRDTAKKWTQQLSNRCRGGNDMRWALEFALGRFADATDVYILTDGNIAPFVLRGGALPPIMQPPLSEYAEACEATYANTSWTDFCGAHPGVTFHFIAIGSNASVLQEMADIGNGNLWESNINNGL
ncbi:hypothetical protein Pelo_13586 [Pelomyxa schiedti]|nr:hypothetical protein Pelo_13586 [Pelomyxa schiedti]